MGRAWWWVALALLLAPACGERAHGSRAHAQDLPPLVEPLSAPVIPQQLALSGSFTALTYNVAGLPAGLSRSSPSTNTPIIGPLLNRYDLVLLQESWQTPNPNPAAPLRAYHEILAAASKHPYKSAPAMHPFGDDPDRPSALLGDGLNLFARFPGSPTRRQRWSRCVDTANDCLALKGFSMTPLELAPGVPLHVYNLHNEAGRSAEDDASRSAGIDQLLAYIEKHSKGHALIIGGDFNLRSAQEPGATLLARLRESAGLHDACVRCERPGNIDKLLYRPSEAVELRAESWRLERDVFVDEEGEPLSDHLPLAVRFRWAIREPVSP